MIQLDKYRDKWLKDGFNDYIGFYPREFFMLDNFSAFQFKYKGKVYATVEHAYQAYKFKNTAPKIAKQIEKSLSPDRAKKIAHENKDKVDPNWDKINLALMEALCRAKAEQNPYVVEKLLQTKDYLICEDSPVDAFWGIGKNRDGQNELGKIWMKLREEFKNKQ